MRRHLADTTLPFLARQSLWGHPLPSQLQRRVVGVGGAHTTPFCPLTTRSRRASGRGADKLVVDSSVQPGSAVLALLHVLQAEGLIAYSEKEKTVNLTSPASFIIGRPRAAKLGVEVKVVAVLKMLLTTVSFPTAAFA